MRQDTDAEEDSNYESVRSVPGVRQPYLCSSQPANLPCSYQPASLPCSCQPASLPCSCQPALLLSACLALVSLPCSCQLSACLALVILSVCLTLPSLPCAYQPASLPCSGQPVSLARSGQPVSLACSSQPARLPLKRTFQNRWVSEFPWLVFDQGIMTCKICIEAKKDNVFCVGKPERTPEKTALLNIKKYRPQSSCSYSTVIGYAGSFHSYVIASDNITHSKETVITYIDMILDLLPANMKTTSFWSHSPSSQFKNRYHIASLAGLQQDHKEGNRKKVNYMEDIVKRLHEYNSMADTPRPCL